jgi:hypothetical protein
LIEPHCIRNFRRDGAKHRRNVGPPQWRNGWTAAAAHRKRLTMREDWQLTATRTIDLDHEPMLLLHGRPGTQVRVIYGGVWLTEDGDRRDHFPRGGEAVTLAGRGAAVIQALGVARIQISEPMRGRWSRRLTAATASLRRLIVSGRRYAELV